MSIKPSFTFYVHILIHCFVNIIQGNIYNKYTEKIVDLSVKTQVVRSMQCIVYVYFNLCRKKRTFYNIFPVITTGIYPSIYYKVFKSTSILLGGYLNTIRPTTEVHFAGVFPDGGSYTTQIVVLLYQQLAHILFIVK